MSSLDSSARPRSSKMLSQVPVRGNMVVCHRGIRPWHDARPQKPPCAG